MFSQLTSAVLLLFLAAGLARADGGTVRLSQTVGAWTITVFTSPTPPRAGLIDVSVMVQDVTGQTHTNLPVRVSGVHGDRRVFQIATVDAATNKLLLAALIDFQEAGDWQMRVEVQDVAVSFPLVLAEPRPAWWPLLPWIGWPLLAVVLYLVHRRLVQRRAAKIRTEKPITGPGL